MMVKALLERGFNIVGAGPSGNRLEEIATKYNIEVCQHFAEMGKVDAVIACTHSEKIRLDANNIDLIRRNGKKLLVVDVAEPSNLEYQEYKKCKDRVIRQDAGNAYSPNLRYVLGAIAYRMFRLTRGVAFGCFTEALVLAATLQSGNESVKSRDWFQVSEENMEFVAKLYKQYGFTIPSPRCYGKAVNSFNLDLKPVAKQKTNLETILGTIRSRIL
jgi:hypothetical protein